MSMDLESRLRAALRPVTPDETFTRQLLARVIADQARTKQRRFTWRGAKPLAWWLSAGLAASLLLAVGVQQHLEEQARQRGMEARREVVEALRMTSQKLNLAYEAVQSQASSLADEKPGV
jgi:hypothetical protein